MFEHASLQELYTGSLIAGKGKHLNNIRVIMERSKFALEDWVRVRFGAGTPWRRCWCVIEPPNEKDWQKSQKSLKKKSAYERPQLPKGDIKFYDSKKTKKTVPIATITDAYSAYAIYPQSKPLIDQSTLVKLEGRITIHSKPESKTEGFVFVMPEVHPAVSGFEMMLRWLFPVYDAFGLYGRPTRLIADTLDARGLMFAMPKERRYGYLEILDVTTLIHTQGSDKWTEREWRKQLKDATSRRMQLTTQSGTSINLGGRGAHRASLGSRNGVRYDDNGSTQSIPSASQNHNEVTDANFATPNRVATAPPNAQYSGRSHHRSASESVASPSPTKNRRQNQGYVPSRLSVDQDIGRPIEPAPASPALQPPYQSGRPNTYQAPEGRSDSDSEPQPYHINTEEVRSEVVQQSPPAPVMTPPNFQHQAFDQPRRRPDVRPDLRREKSRMSDATLHQLVDASKMHNGGVAGAAAAAAWRGGEEPRGVNETPADHEMSANHETQKVVADVSYADSPVDTRQSRRSRKSSEHSVSRKPLPQSRSGSEHSVVRKPLPGQTTSEAPPMPPMPQQQTPDKVSQYSVSLYDRDGAVSDTSPDYASRQSEAVPPFKPIPRQRAGVLKTTGDTALSEGVPRNLDIPAVDFGVTRSLTPGPSRPGSCGGLLGRVSPLESKTPPSNSRSPSNISNVSTPSDEKRDPYMDRTSPRPGLSHSRSSSSAWFPGTVAGRQSPGPTLSPEEFVQQRASAAGIPQGYVPQRTMSSGKLEQVSTRKLTKKRDSYNRPSSRTSPTPLIDYSSNLSAREQEHVARMTGGPLLNMAERSRTPDPAVGLIGAIEAREQEKRNMREGYSGHMVQAAIAQRQQQAQAQAQAQQAAQRAYMPFYHQATMPPTPGQNGQYAPQQQPQYYNGTQMPAQQQWQSQQNYPPQQGSVMREQYPQQQQYPPQQQQGHGQNSQQQMYQRQHNGYHSPQDGYGYGR